MGWLDHKELKIIKGIGKTPTDTFSAEIDPVVVNLMGGIISLERDGWSPNIPALKNGGVWTDSPLSDGRQLLAAAEGNVIEKIAILITDTTYLAVQKALSGINQMAYDCRNFWQTQDQIDPVYLQWYASCGAGPQHALISNIEVSPQYLDGDKPTIRVDLAIEREPYWRGLVPGANPKLWSFYVNSQRIGTNKVLANASLVDTITLDHLINDSAANKFEWTPAALGLQATPISRNYVDIPASKVAGDVPALTEIYLQSTQEVPATFYIGLSSKKMALPDRTGITRTNALVLNAGDAGSGSTITKTNTGSANTGIISNGSAVNFYRGDRAVAAPDGAYVNIANWVSVSLGADPNGIAQMRQLMRGTYVIFIRASNHLGAALTDARMRLVIEEFEGSPLTTGIQYIATQTLPDAYVPAGAAYTSAKPLTYMGTITIPFSSRAKVGADGTGITVQQGGAQDLRVTLQQQFLVAPGARTFQFTDIIFMPIDEGFAQIINVGGTNVGSTFGSTILDNTGYLTHGEPRQVAESSMFSSPASVSQEVRGSQIMLKPKTDQRLYFLNDGLSSLSRPTASMSIRVNIVPRWSGIRDV